MYDFHLHSYHSDGVSNPSDICRVLVEKGIKGFALTDHDTIDGLQEARQTSSESGLDFLSGVEMNCTWDIAWAPNSFHYHLICLGFDEQSEFILDLISKAKENELERTEQLMSRLTEWGFEFNIAECKSYLQDTESEHTATVDMWSVIKIGISKEYWADNISAKKTVFKAYEQLRLDFKKKARIEHVIETVHRAGGITIAAHPFLYFKDKNQVSELIHGFIQAGLDGIEVFHFSNHTPEQREYIQNLIDETGLLVSGGTDSHDISAYPEPDPTLWPSRDQYDNIVNAIREMQNRHVK